MEINPFFIALLDLPKITPRKVKNLLTHFRDPEKIFKAKREELATIDGIDEETISNILRFKIKDCQEKIKRAQELKVKIISFLDEEYPQGLLNIKFFPPVLFLQGEIKKEDEKSIAIVGTRNPSVYGRDVAERFSFELAENGLTIISGLARGIDTLAHQGALAAGGRTIAVLGCGIDIPYPVENKNLREKIVERGAIISEFNLGTPPDRFNFPRRNRIISGLALAVLAVEAPEKSGVLITAWWASEQGKEVFAIPGPITSKRSEGTNRLIKDGATMVTSPAEILENLKIIPSKKEGRKLELSAEEEKVLALISEAPLYVDEIVERLEKPVSEVLIQLFHLEIMGIVKQLPGNRYIRAY
jgi:DNA processing protein|uniref:DNA-protecting protein DprA n=1 Tax=candidate division WOR-3 bacterium TaxID=2052148 RepID=A0A7C3UU68_UNCW3